MRNSEKGMALALVLVFTAALMLLGSALIVNALNEKLIADYQAQDIRKLYLAEAGLEAGLAALHQNFFYNRALTGSLMNGNYRVTFENSSPACRRIKSAATIENYTLEIVLTVCQNPDGTLTVGEWKRL